MFIKKSALLATVATLGFALLAPTVNASTNLVESYYLNAGISGIGGLFDNDPIPDTLNSDLSSLITGDTFDFKIIYTNPSALAGFESDRVAFDSFLFSNITVTLNGVSQLVTAPGVDALFWQASGSSTFIGTSSVLEITGNVNLGTGNASGDAIISVIPNLPITSVPEPEQWAMLLLGLPLLSSVARMKKAAKA